MKKTIAVLAGDGIGPEVTYAAIALLKDCATAFGHTFEFPEFPFGGVAIDKCGEPLPAETLAGCKAADAILLGAIGGPKWEAMPLGKRPEAGLLGMRQALGLFINLRPIKVRPALRDISPLRPERLGEAEFEIVRELTGDVYFGEHKIEGDGKQRRAWDVANYSYEEIERVAKYSFARAMARNKRLTSVDKANVLATSTLWRQTVTAMAADYPGVTLEHMYVDNASMQILLRPTAFDVILTGNLFGDILSDEAAALAGSIGLIPSMSRGQDGEPALYEPIHGSAPTLAGKDVASPLGAIFSATMMLRESFALNAEAQAMEAAADRAIEKGFRTADIAAPGAKSVRGSELTAQIRAELREGLASAAKAAR